MRSCRIPTSARGLQPTPRVEESEKWSIDKLETENFFKGFNIDYITRIYKKDQTGDFLNKVLKDRRTFKTNYITFWLGEDVSSVFGATTALLHPTFVTVSRFLDPRLLFASDTEKTKHGSYIRQCEDPCKTIEHHKDKNLLNSQKSFQVTKTARIPS